MQPEETIEIERAVRARARNRDRRTQPVVLGLAVRNHHVEAIDGTAVEDRNQKPSESAGGPGARRVRGPGQERRRETDREHRHRARSEEHSPGRHGYLR
jgi:hypothetical protein